LNGRELNKGLQPIRTLPLSPQAQRYELVRQLNMCFQLLPAGPWAQWDG
jgi:hypothetical protein